MSSQEQSTNKSKFIEVNFKFAFQNGMTPNILAPLISKALKDIGAVDGWGTITNVVEQDNEVNKVTVVSI